MVSVYPSRTSVRLCVVWCVLGWFSVAVSCWVAGRAAAGLLRVCVAQIGVWGLFRNGVVQSEQMHRFIMLLSLSMFVQSQRFGSSCFNQCATS